MQLDHAERRGIGKRREGVLQSRALILTVGDYATAGPHSLAERDAIGPTALLTTDTCSRPTEMDKLPAEKMGVK